MCMCNRCSTGSRPLQYQRSLSSRDPVVKVIEHKRYNIPYLREKGPMGGAPYIGSRLGGGPIFAVSLSQLHAIERPGKLPMRSSLLE